MTLAAFQRAFADIAASPVLCRTARADPMRAFGGYDLTPREFARLSSAVHQPGMDAQCSLYRITRLAALNSIAPLSLAALTPGLRPLVDAYWDAHPVHDNRFAAEAARFLAFLNARPDLLAEAAGPAAAVVCDLFRLELAVEEVRLLTPVDEAEPFLQSLSLSHHPEALLAAGRDGLEALARVGAEPARLLIAAEAGQQPRLYVLDAVESVEPWIKQRSPHIEGSDLPSLIQ